MKEIKNAYVYSHTRVDNNIVFYIGIGTSKEFKRAYSLNGRNRFWRHVVAKTKYEVEILFENITIEQANSIEIQLIKKYGRRDLGNGVLVNLTDGGEGINNLNEEAKELVRKKYTAAHKKKRKPVYQYSLDGTFVKKWTDIYEILITNPKYKIPPIYDCCRGVCKTTYGYQWFWQYNGESVAPRIINDMSVMVQKLVKFSISGDYICITTAREEGNNAQLYIAAKEKGGRCIYHRWMYEKDWIMQGCPKKLIRKFISIGKTPHYFSKDEVVDTLGLSNFNDTLIIIEDACEIYKTTKEQLIHLANSGYVTVYRITKKMGVAHVFVRKELNEIYNSKVEFGARRFDFQAHLNMVNILHDSLKCIETHLGIPINNICLEILKRISKGKTIAVIAKELGMSSQNVEYHYNNLPKQLTTYFSKTQKLMIQ